MFVGRSSEERELSREEMGFSLNPLAALAAVRNIITSPTAKTLAASGALGPQAALVARADMAAKGIKSAAKAAVPAKAAAAAPAAAAEEEVSSLPAKAASATVGRWTNCGFSSHSDDDISTLIARERDPEKRQRMILSHERAKRMRAVTTSGSGVSEVEDAIGELFARVPLDAQRRPYLDRGQVRDLSLHMASKWAGGRPTADGVARARKLVAVYTRINNIATPGLKAVRV